MIYDDYIIHFTNEINEKEILIWLLDYEIMSHVYIAEIKRDIIVSSIDFAIGQTVNAGDEILFPKQNIQVQELPGIVEVLFYDRVVFRNPREDQLNENDLFEEYDLLWVTFKNGQIEFKPIK